MKCDGVVQTLMSLGRVLGSLPSRVERGGLGSRSMRPAQFGQKPLVLAKVVKG